MQDFLSAASQFINTTSRHIFLTGKAGTGKTTFLKNLSNISYKNHIVVAPTGIAALNAGGVTIHSQFLLPPRTFIPERLNFDPKNENPVFVDQTSLARKHPLTGSRKQVLRSIDLLVIDEVSMLRADLLDAIDYRMKSARQNFKQSFGGVQVLFIGDLYQLPPVIRNNEESTLKQYYKSPWFYEAKALQAEPPVYIELDKVFRQQDDHFLSILNNLRNDESTKEDIEKLNEHYRSEEEISQLSEIITLTTHNYIADDLNRRELKALNGSLHYFEADVEGDFPESMYPVLSTIELKIGTQVMFTRNDNEEQVYFNGKLATVKEISGDAIWVELAESKIRYQLRKERWENRKYFNVEGNEVEEKVVGSFEQFPIKLAWAITVHKSQGLTFDNAIIDLGEAFASGQVYVALSRLRTLGGLVLRSKINVNNISTDKNIVSFANENNHPEQLDGKMKQGQQQYIEQRIKSTFDFSAIIGNISYGQRKVTEPSLNDSSMQPLLTQIATALNEEKSNVDKFIRQLHQLLASKNIEDLKERIAKGSAYYKAHLSTQLTKLLDHIAVIKTKKRVKTYLNHLLEIDQGISQKLEEVDTCLLVVNGILNEEDVAEKLKELAKVRKQKRLDSIANAEANVEKNMPAKDKKKLAEKADKRSTYEISLDMAKEGKSVQEIANERFLVEGTIEGHLAKAVGERKLDIFEFMDKDSVDLIEEAMGELSKDVGSKEIFDKLQGEFSYGQIRAVMAHVKLNE